MSHKVGVIGLGLMGSALADGLLAHLFDLTVWNRSAEKSSRFAQQDVAVADSVEDLASACDVIVCCLTDQAASMQVLGEEAVAKAMAGKTLVLVCTMNAEESIAAATWAGENGIAYLDGAILGYPSNIRDQCCIVVYSGPKALFDSCSAILNALGGMPRLVGEQAGAALYFDKAVYSTYYAHVTGLLHGAAMCHAAGAPIDTFVEVMTDYWDWSSEDAAMLRQVKNRNYSGAECTLEVHANDYELMIPATCERLGVSNKFQRVIAEYLDRAVADGYGESELAALFEVLGKPD